jgi:hypothetical protein
MEPVRYHGHLSPTSEAAFRGRDAGYPTPLNRSARAAFSCMRLLPRILGVEAQVRIRVPRI